MHNNSPIKRNISRKRVFVGLSGGVDSAVSAALLVRDGYDVTGVFIRIVLPGYPCPAVTDRQDAMRVAAHLRIPFREIDLSQEYAQRVFSYTLSQYAKGRTPNPDTLCNREIKFGVFYDYCIREGADRVATGHYAQLAHDTTPPELQVSIDTTKDQSYFLWMVPDSHLAHTLFPVGHLTKPQVRALAKSFDLPNARRKDSQGLCFLGDLSISDLLTQEIRPTPGDVLSETGIRIGRHDGAALYTLGQRHGFTVDTTTTSGQKPMYVIAKDMSHNTITVSENKFPQGASHTSLEITDCNWIGSVRPGECMARFRYRQTLIPAQIHTVGSSSTVVLSAPYFVPEGQSLVLYRGTRCLGGGVINDTHLI